MWEKEDRVFFFGDNNCGKFCGYFGVDFSWSNKECLLENFCLWCYSNGLLNKKFCLFMCNGGLFFKKEKDKEKSKEWRRNCDLYKDNYYDEFCGEWEWSWYFELKCNSKLGNVSRIICVFYIRVVSKDLI